MPGLLRVEGSKQPQVSALPERRVKKQRQTALMGYIRSSRGLRFFVPAAGKPADISGVREYIIPEIIQRRSCPLFKPQSAPRAPERAVLRVPLRSILLNPGQPRRRFAPETIAELAESIRLHGLLSPLLVRGLGGGKYQLIAGERRLRALESLGRTQAEVIALPAGEGDCAVIALVENLQREDLHYLDVAAACRRILDEQPITQERLAASLGCSAPALANRLRLLKLPQPVQDALRRSGLSERHARALLAAADEEEQMSLLRQAAEEKMSVQQLEACVERRRPAARGPRRVSRIVRDNRIIINAVLDTVRQLRRIGVGVTSRVEERPDGVDVIVSIPACAAAKK